MRNCSNSSTNICLPLNRRNMFAQVHPEINVGPVQTFANIFLLFKGKHMLVEKLLQFLVDIVDADLLKGVEVKDLEASDVEDTNVAHPLHLWVTESLVTLVRNDPKGALIDGTSDTGDGVGGVLASIALLHPLCTDLQLGLAEVLAHPLTVNSQ